MMQDMEAHPLARLKASELLGKSQADFTDKMQHSVSKSLEDLIRESEETA
jgi:hypothetical protein